MIRLLNQVTGRPTRSRTICALVAPLIVAALVVPFLFPPQTVQAENRHHGNPFTLAGTWRYTIPAPPPGFFAYETFTEAGGSVETNHGPGGPSAAIGTWTRIGPRKFLATFYKQVFKPASGGPFPFEPDSIVKVRRLMTLSPDGNELTGLATVEIYDPAGNLVMKNPTHPFQGTRIVAEMPDL
jgi:hypothetical protein